MGSHTAKGGFYFQHSYKPQSIFSSFNSQIDFVDDSNNPFDTSFAYANAATGVFRTYTQASKYALPEWRYKNFEWFAQDNWKITDRLTLDYGVRFYYLTPQWDTTLQASNFLPDQFDPSQAVRLFQPAIWSIGVTGWARPGDRPDGQRALHRARGAGLGRSLQWRVPGRPGHQRPAAGRQQLQDLAARRLRLRHHRQVRRRSSAAAGASSTIGRRATWSST